MKILFLHGYGSDPNGIRPTFLKENGYEAVQRVGAKRDRADLE